MKEVRAFRPVPHPFGGRGRDPLRLRHLPDGQSQESGEFLAIGDYTHARATPVNRKVARSRGVSPAAGEMPALHPLTLCCNYAEMTLG